MTNEEAIKIIEVVKAECEWNAPLDYQAALDMAISALGAIDQYRWERDIAVEQLKELGYELGEKIRTDGDCISRQAAIDAVEKESQVDGAYGYMDTKSIVDLLNDLPSAQQDGIPLEWINKHLEWLDNCDNEFAQLAKVGIRAMVELWKKDRI